MLNDYLARLKNALHNDIEERDEILNFMEEMINDRMENGEKLEDILASLGEPETVAESFLDTTSAKQTAEERPKETVCHYEFHHIHRIDIDSINCSYEFCPFDDDRFLVDIETDGDPGITVRDLDGVLKIDQDPIEGDFRSMFLNWSVSKDLFRRKALIRIVIPQDNCCDLKIDNVSGSIKGEDITFEKVKIDCVSGPLEFTNARMGSFKSESVSGSVRLQNVTVEKKAEMEIVSGSVRASALRCPDISTETVSGPIDLQIEGRKKDYDIRTEKLFKDEHISGSGDRRLKIESISGRIRYGFSE